MMRYSILFSLLSIGVVSLSGSAAAQPCDQLLQSRTYACDVTSDTGNQFDDCFRFTTPGSFVPIDLFVDLAGTFFTCTCQPRGPAASPRFDTSRRFECVGSADDGTRLSFTGKAGGQRFRLSAVNEFGVSFFGICRRQTACNVAVVQSLDEDPGGWSAKR